MLEAKSKLASIRASIDAKPDNLPGAKGVVAEQLEAYKLLSQVIDKLIELETRVSALEKP